MARAKRTQRAEARRRSRAATAPDQATDPSDGSVLAANASRPATSAPAKPPADSGRVSISTAFRASFRPLNVRDDFMALPWIAVHTPALWVPLLVTVASAVLTAVAGSNDLVVNIVFPYFVMFPAIGGVFIGGFLAPRASWLVGLIVGLAAATCYIVLGLAKLLPDPFQATFDVSPQEAAITALIWSALFGAFLGAAAAWYRRFLRYSSPNRNRGKSQSSKQGQKKSGDGRTRSATTSQKAPVKR